MSDMEKTMEFDPRKFTLFSEREALGHEFERWADENDVLLCGSSMISWLETNDLLNVERAISYVKRLKEREDEGR